MNNFHFGFVLMIVGFLGACASPKISLEKVAESDPVAVALLDHSQRAQGLTAFRKVQDIQVRYEGRWALIGPRFQPILSDRNFRGGSDEKVYIDSPLMRQEHTGPAGKKEVVRTKDDVTVRYNGVLSSDVEKKQAAALVADAYRMFLLGPFYFRREGVTLAQAGSGSVDGALCDEILAVLRPGFGTADEDRVILSIDRATRQLRRVRLTLNGLESTRGAEVEVTFRKFKTFSGIVFPTDFDERIRVPFDLPAHRWEIVELTTNRH